MNAKMLVPGTPEADLEAAILEREGKTVKQIAVRFEPLLSDGAVKAAIARGRHQLNQQAPKPTPVVRPGPLLSPPAPAASPTPDPVEQLLAWAEKEGPSRAATLAARTRSQLKELADLRDRQQASAEERELIATLEKQLADAKQRLRQMTGVSAPRPASMPSGAPKTDAARIRAWAADNGHTVPPRGRIAKPIVEAYNAAHAESGAD